MPSGYCDPTNVYFYNANKTFANASAKIKQHRPRDARVTARCARYIEKRKRSGDGSDSEIGLRVGHNLVVCLKASQHLLRKQEQHCGANESDGSSSTACNYKGAANFDSIAFRMCRRHTVRRNDRHGHEADEENPASHYRAVVF